MTLTRSESTVERILSSAQSLFLKRNYADVTMSGIAAFTGLTKGALYHHFRSKEALYLALLHADLAAKQALFARAIATRDGCRQRLNRLTRAFFELPPEKRQLIQLVRRDVNVFRDPARSDLIRAYQAALPDQVEQVMGDGIADGELAPGDARLLSWHFVAMVDVTLRTYAGSVFHDPNQKLEHVLGLFFGGAQAIKQGGDR